MYQILVDSSEKVICTIDSRGFIWDLKDKKIGKLSPIVSKSSLEALDRINLDDERVVKINGIVYLWIEKKWYEVIMTLNVNGMLV